MLNKIPGNLSVGILLLAGWRVFQNLRRGQSKVNKEKAILEREVMSGFSSPSFLKEDCPEGSSQHLDENTLNSPATFTARSGNSSSSSGNNHSKKLYALLGQLKQAVDSDGGFPICAIVNGDLERSLLRFLVDADFVVDRARENIAQMKKWREENDVDNILRWILPEEKLEHLRRCMPSSYHGFDKKGHPIHLEQTGYFNWEILKHCSADDLVKMHILFMEYQSRVLFPRASAEKGYTVDSMANIVDLRGLNIRVLSNLHALNIFKEVQRIDQKNYPGMLSVTYIVNANWVFRAVWNVLKAVFPARDHKKMKMIPPGAKGLKMLKEVIPERHIPRILGGDCDCEFGCVSGPAGSGSKESDNQAKMMKDLKEIRRLFSANNLSNDSRTEKRIQKSIRIWSIDPERNIMLEYTESQTSIIKEGEEEANEEEALPKYYPPATNGSKATPPSGAYLVLPEEVLRGGAD
jgi:hypothetical protein